MATISVKDYVMLLTSQSIVSQCSNVETVLRTIIPVNARSNPYRICEPIHRIICVDGTSLSVQAHGACHVIFNDVKPNGLYSPTFGKELAMCETDCEDLDQYGINSIEDIEAYVESHGGIDIQATTSCAVKHAIECLSKY